MTLDIWQVEQLCRLIEAYPFMFVSLKPTAIVAMIEYQARPLV